MTTPFLRTSALAAFSLLALGVALAPQLGAAEAAPAAKTPAAAPAPRGPVLLLWPNGAPGSEGKTAPEKTDERGNVSSIHQPSLTVYLPAPAQATGAAVLVIPGGGHRLLVIDHEGYNVGAWLAAHGIAGFVLKHRLAREEGSTYKIEVESRRTPSARCGSSAAGPRSGRSTPRASEQWDFPPAANWSR